MGDVQCKDSVRSDSLDIAVPRLEIGHEAYENPLEDIVRLVRDGLDERSFKAMLVSMHIHLAASLSCEFGTHSSRHSSLRIFSR